MEFLEAVKKRRSIYGINNQVTISEEKIKQLVSDAVKYSPSAFNSQSSRAVLLFGEHHLKLWGIVKNTLKAMLTTDAYSQTEGKIDAFAAGYGTVLFFEDLSVIKDLQEKFALYKENFPIWAQQSNGMMQFVTWTALENEGLGASLQHYNPIIDLEVKREWNIPDEWKLIGQMPFGAITAQPDEKHFAPIEDRFKFFS
ncbi:MAG: nitroreductase [Bacillales bacterium]|jgi:predicted oxidoreductase (fatty acid repression mutant protein)|nr:nitroreductase [Bacillales bacterium]